MQIESPVSVSRIRIVLDCVLLDLHCVKSIAIVIIRFRRSFGNVGVVGTKVTPGKSVAFWTPIPQLVCSFQSVIAYVARG